MRLGSFTSGAMIALDGRTYRLAVKNTRGWQGVDCENSLLSEWDAEELEAAYTAGRLTFVAEGHSAKERAPPVLVLPDLNARQQAEAIFRAKFLVEVARKRSICASVGGPRVGTKERLAPILAEVSAELGRKEGVSVAAFYRWVALSSQGVAGLVDRRGSKTGRRCSGAPLAKQVMADVIQGAKQTRQVGAPASITMAALEKAVRSRIKTENLNRSTLWPDDPGTNSCSLRAVVEVGFVRAARRSVTGKILTVVEDDVARFSERYVFTPKLASENGLSATSVSARLGNLGIGPILAGKRPVHALWDREMLAGVNFLERWVTSAGVLSEQSSLSLEDR